MEKDKIVKLCESIVKMIKIDIRDTTMTTKQLMEFYHVGRTTILNIKSGKRWSHIFID